MADYVADVLARAARRAQEAALRDACESSDDGDQTTERTQMPKGKGSLKRKELQHMDSHDADSLASTVPATPSEVEKAIKEGQQALAAMQPKVNPPPPSKSAKPRLTREIQSKEVLEDAKPQPESTPPPRTAVKAKAAKPAKPPSVEAKLERTLTPDTSKAVQECLTRASTAELLSSKGTPSTETPKTTPSPSTRSSSKSVQPAPSPPDPSPPPSDDDDDESDDDEETRRQREEEARRIQAKKAAHARYMRFSRSLKSKSTPIEVRRAGQSAYRSSDKLQVLLEQWAACEGHWAYSDFMIECKKKSKHRSYGSRVWMTKSEMTAKFGSLTVAETIIESKENDTDASVHQIRPHPDCHGRDTPETRQYLIWDKEGTEDSEDVTCAELFRAAEQDGSDKGASTKEKKAKKHQKKKASGKKDHGRKKKKKSSSSSDSESDSGSDSDSSGSSSSSSSEDKKGGKKKKGSKATAKEKKQKAKDDDTRERKKTRKEDKEKEPKEETEDQKQKREEKEAETQRKAEEKKKNTEFKKEQRKGNQAVTKLGNHISTAASLGDKLSTMSQSVADAILLEVQPHLDKLRDIRSKLQKAVDAAKADNLGKMPTLIDAANSACSEFQASQSFDANWKGQCSFAAFVGVNTNLPVALEGHYDDVATSVKRAMRRVRDQVADPGGSAVHPDTMKLGSKSGKNDARDFWNFADIPVEIETIRLPVFDKKSVGNAKVEVFPIIHPHRILNYLFDTVGVEVDPCDVHSYWDHARAMQEPWACCSPASRDHMPVGLHGDAARLWTQVRVEKMVGIFVNLPLFRPKSVRHSRWLVFSIGRDKLIKNRTFNVVWERLVWSLNWAFEGVHPRSGPGGRPLTGADLARAGMPLCRSNMRFSVTELRGDWEFHRDVWRFTASWQGQQVCYRCAAGTKGDEAYLYYNGGPTSRWLHEEFSLEQFLARRLKDRQLCPLRHLKGFHHTIIRFCSMHTLNLGLLYVCNAGALLLLCEDFEYFGTGTFAEQLDVAYQDFLAFCRSKRIPHSQPPFLPRMVKKKDGNELFTAKAYNGRVILSWLNHTLLGVLAQRPDHQILHLTSAAVNSMTNIFSISESHGRFLPESAAQELHDNGVRFVDLYKVLCVEHIRMNKNRWLMRPKIHVLLHLSKDVLKYSIAARAHPKRRHIWLLKCTKLRLRTMKHRVERKKTRGKRG
ncbi:unnamed protein product [Cladocopium goreaui]|uniref:Neurofilament heavy polypeptide n=1 Tax=Cladocopium goreaui TaxID=2562237 RepID=A0A9P1FLZ0_9DINO|nr:unnamed protein product [Cladocopium goreaui]